jgi:hypothetical protein
VTSWEEVQCPSALYGEAECGSSGGGEKGVLRYKNGYWHDGLDLNHRSQGCNGETWCSGVANDTAGVNRTTFHYKEGEYLHVSSRFYRCPGFDRTCYVHPTDGYIMCKEGNAGLLCNECAPNYVAQFNGECVLCEDGAKGSSLVAAGASTVVTLMLFGIFMWRKRHYRSTAFTFNGASHVVGALVRAVSAKAKIISSYFQMILLLGGVYQIRFPTPYLEFLSYFSIFEFDFIQMASVGCFVTYDFHATLYFTSALLIALEVLLLVGLILERYYLKQSTKKDRERSHEGAHDEWWARQAQKGVAWVLFTTYLLYPLGCKVGRSACSFRSHSNHSTCPYTNQTNIKKEH